MPYTVEHLVSVNPYNPDILPDLQNYVNEQVSSESYSLDANLCLLRLYQAIRNYAIHVLSLTYQKLPSSVLAE
nr:eukaryotic translation initiation factor 3 subunit K [Tanacetum cinerariifolium]